MRAAAAWMVGVMMVATTAPALAGVYEERERDWRNGAVVYQVIVDRFAPAANLDAKRALYAAPKVLRRWDEVPMADNRLAPGTQVTHHELDFWGGDLQSLRGRLDHVQALGADVLYLNPIHLGFTNHKYDALDFQAVSPEYGTREDVKVLAAELRRRGMKLVLDGVFNHMGRQAPACRQAAADARSATRDWFVFGAQYPGGARTWKSVLNLPELNLDSDAVRAHIWADRDSVLRSDLRDGADGWRLAFERHTDRAADAVLVLANTGGQAVSDIVQWRNGLMMDGTTLRDLLPPPAGSPAVAVYGGFVRITLPPRSVRVLRARCRHAGRLLRVQARTLVQCSTLCGT